MGDCPLYWLSHSLPTLLSLLCYSELRTGRRGNNKAGCPPSLPGFLFSSFCKQAPGCPWTCNDLPASALLSAGISGTPHTRPTILTFLPSCGTSGAKCAPLLLSLQRCTAPYKTMCCFCSPFWGDRVPYFTAHASLELAILLPQPSE